MLGGFWILFIDAIEHSKRKANLRILEDQTKHRKVIEFVLLIENNKKIRIQFICGRIDANIPFILYTFDLDIVQVTYDDERIIPTIGSFQAIATRSFICYNLTNSILNAPLYVDRCLKHYSQGFIWICSIAYDETLVKNQLISKKKSN